MKICALLVIFALFYIAPPLFAEPAPPPNVLYKPTFLLMDDSWTAGTAFIVRIPGQEGLFLITANHLFGPDAGLKDQMTPDQVASDVKGVVGLSMQDLGQTVCFPDFVKIDDAGSVELKSLQKDLAVFHRKDLPDQKALAFATDMPKKGDRVWVFARQRGDDKPDLLAATVVTAIDRELTYDFDKSDFRLPGTSGAPVLNEKGDVVGIHLACGTTKDGAVQGWANPVSSVRAELAKALPSK